MRNLLAETPIAAAASISPRPNTTGKSGNMSIRAVARFMIHTEAKIERLVLGHPGKFAFRDECLGRADREIDSRGVQFGWIGEFTRSAVGCQHLLTLRSRAMGRVLAAGERTASNLAYPLGLAGVQVDCQVTDKPSFCAEQKPRVPAGIPS
jgi:hypothetical protein